MMGSFAGFVTMAELNEFTLSEWMINKDVGPAVLVLDGGVSTHLEDLTSEPFPYRELWSSSLLLDEVNDGIIRQGHMDWIEAGADVLSSLTYQCHYEKELWPKHVTGGTIDEGGMDNLWRKAIRLCHEATQVKPTNRRVFILASSGCFGAALANGAEYTGEYPTIDDVGAFHARKIKTASSLQVDGICIETVPSIQECKEIRNILLSATLPPNMCCFLSLACRNNAELNDGTALQTALEVFRDVPSDRLHGVGLKCCNADHLKSLVACAVSELQKNHPRRGIILYPNRGESWNAERNGWENDGLPDEKLVKVLVDRAVQIKDQWATCPSILLGGCCRTSPHTISLLRKAVDGKFCQRT